MPKKVAKPKKTAASTTTVADATDDTAAKPAPPKPAPKKRKRAPAKKKEPPAEKMAPPPQYTLLLDNGGDTIKYGWSTDTNPSIMPNCTARLPQQWTVLVGDEINTIQSVTQISHSTERGMITNLGNQMLVWKRILDKLQVRVTITPDTTAFGWKPNKSATINPQHCAILLLLPPQTPSILLEQIYKCWKNDFGFGHVGFQLSVTMAATVNPYETATVVDLGWSAMHIVTLHQRNVLAIRRVPLGGRHLQRAYQHYLSYRQVHLMDQPVVMRQIWKATSRLSLNFREELQNYTQQPYDSEFVLPDWSTTRIGRLRSIQQPHTATNNIEQQPEEAEPVEEDDPSDEEESLEERRARLLRRRQQEERRRLAAQAEEQVVRMGVERFVIPEAIFYPKLLGLPFAGLAETVDLAIRASPSHFQSALYRSIQLTGGLSQLKHIEERLLHELRPLAPVAHDIAIATIPTAWQGAQSWVQERPYSEWSLTRHDVTQFKNADTILEKYGI